MDKKQFELECMHIILSHPEGYVDKHWIIKYDLIDREYYVRWNNGLHNQSYREFRAYFKDGLFSHI